MSVVTHFYYTRNGRPCKGMTVVTPGGQTVMSSNPMIPGDVPITEMQYDTAIQQIQDDIKAVKDSAKANLAAARASAVNKLKTTAGLTDVEVAALAEMFGG